MFRDVIVRIHRYIVYFEIKHRSHKASSKVSSEGVRLSQHTHPLYKDTTTSVSTITRHCLTNGALSVEYGIRSPVFEVDIAGRG